MLDTQFPPWPSFSDEEVTSVSKTLASNRVNYWTGQECRQFEKEFATWSGSNHAISLSNGTLALDLCWKVLGIGSGDEVICTPRSFMASASSIITAGATPVFADVDADSQNITPETAIRVLTPKTRAILCVHLAGWPCDMEGFRKLAASNNLLLVEDCAQAHGAAWNGKPVGSWSDMAAWSFCQDKIMTTGGEGGMVTTDSKAHWTAGWSYKDHGKSWEGVYERQHPPGFRWVHDSFGTNWRMLEMQAAIGRIQLRAMTDWQKKREANANAIWDAARKLDVLRVPDLPNAATHACYKAYVFVRPERLKAGWTRDRMIHEINHLGVPCYQGSCPEMYLERAFENHPSKPRDRLPVAKALGETSLMFLVHPTLEAHHIEKTIDVLTNVCGQAKS